MNEHAREWLLAMLWGLDQITDPRLSRAFETAEQWEYRHRLRHTFRRLEHEGLVRRQKHLDRLVWSLTDLGRLAALGGRNPEARWARPWDGTWRMVLFDLPEKRHSLRKQLLRWLHQNHFGYLQDSVWIHPDPLQEVAATLEEFRDDVESFTIMESQCGAGYANDAVVRGAWDFSEINRRYTNYLQRYADRPPKLSAGTTGRVAKQWLREEALVWHHAFDLDPLLPNAVLPAGYQGVHAWQARRHILTAFSARLPFPTSA
jgi:phenylacetic acid degradation operon negative regulatory protein